MIHFVGSMYEATIVDQLVHCKKNGKDASNFPVAYIIHYP